MESSVPPVPPGASQKRIPRGRPESSDAHFFPSVLAATLNQSVSQKGSSMSHTTPLRLPKLPSDTASKSMLRKRLVSDFSGIHSADYPRFDSAPRNASDTPYKDSSIRQSRRKARDSSSLSRKAEGSFERGSNSEADTSETSITITLKAKLKGRKRKQRTRNRICASADFLLDDTVTNAQKTLLPVAKRIVKPVIPNPDLFPMVYTYLSSKLSSIILESNGMPSVPANQYGYKFYVGPGNNDQLIALLMKRRWYWTRVDSWPAADFIWTQNRTQEIVQKLPVSTHALVESSNSAQSFRTLKRVSRLVLAQARLKNSGLELITSSQSLVRCEEVPLSAPVKLYNRLEKNHQITSKKWLFLNMKRFYEERNEDPFKVIPLTFLIEDGNDDREMRHFLSTFGDLSVSSKNIWIIKPGENTNCGYGIHVSSNLSDIRNLVRGASKAKRRTFLIQKYLEKPLLINRRKFDIRCYGLMTSINGHVQGYFYHDGYLRTSSREFSLIDTSDRFIHLTNDAVQKTSEDYGRFENANKLSYPEFHKFLQQSFPTKKIDFWVDIWPQIRKIMTDTFKATWDKLDPGKRMYTFEVLGYDFMIDEDFHVWLIEVNTNPCLSLCSAYLSRLIPAMLENALRIALDPLFPEPPSKKHSQEWAAQPFENRFELVFSSVRDAESHCVLEISGSETDDEAEPA